MGKTYRVAPDEVIDLVERVRTTYHPERLDRVKLGIIFAHAPVDEKTGLLKGFAIKGHAGAQAAACVKTVALKDRLTKGYDVEFLIDGDTWPQKSEKEQIALIDHELTHIRPVLGQTDDLNRPKIKMRDEDFIIWGFLEVAQRHGIAAVECQSVKRLIDEHGQILLALDEGKGAAGIAVKKFVDTIRKSGSTVTISGDGIKPVTIK